MITNMSPLRSAAVALTQAPAVREVREIDGKRQADRVRVTAGEPYRPPSTPSDTFTPAAPLTPSPIDPPPPVIGSGTGQVSWFSNEKGYGFLRTAGGDDLFFQFKNIDVPGYQTLAGGQAVTFDIVAGIRGPEAIRVRPA